MKKLLFALVAVCAASTASAQLVQSTTVTRVEQVKVNISGMYLDLAVGDMTEKAGGFELNDGSTAVGVGLGYRQGFNQYIAWDIIGLNVFTQASGDAEDVYIQGISAIRGTSPVFFAKMSAFASVGMGYGYGYMAESEGEGLAFELKLGINLTPSINIGFRYNNQKVRNPDGGAESTFGVSAFNLGFLF